MSKKSAADFYKDTRQSQVFKGLEEDTILPTLELETTGEAVVAITTSRTFGPVQNACFRCNFGEQTYKADAIEQIFGQDPLAHRMVEQALVKLEEQAEPETVLALLPSHLKRRENEYILRWEISRGSSKYLVMTANGVLSVHDVLSSSGLANARQSALANLAHEFRSPLSAILGYAEMLVEEHQQHPQLCEDLDTIALAATNLLHLVNDVLDFTKLDAGHSRAHPTLFNLRELFEEIERVQRPHNHLQHNLVNIEVEEDIGQVQTDRDKLRQVLLNLLSNATKFTLEGTIGLRGRRGFDNPDELVLEIEDTGLGMDEETREKAFERFEQGNNASTVMRRGTGLGLFICAEFVSLLGGEIELASTPGEGTIFTISLPNALSQSLEADTTPE